MIDDKKPDPKDVPHTVASMISGFVFSLLFVWSAAFVAKFIYLNFLGGGDG